MQIRFGRDNLFDALQSLKYNPGICSLMTPLQHWLAGSGEQNRYAKDTLICIKGIDNRLKEICWQRLNLIENDNAIADVMQFSTMG